METKRNLSSQFKVGEKEAGFNLSWGAIIAGVFTFFALLFTFSLIGSAIGFGILSPTNSEPFKGVGIGVILWTIVTFVLSFMGAGFVAGVAARRIGLIHGFLTWATSLIALVAILSFVTVGALSSVGSMFGSAISTLGGGVGNLASAAGDQIADGVSSLSDNFADIDTKELEGNVEKVLKDTEIKELQPDYLKNELTKAKDSVKEAGKDILTSPEKSDEVIDKLTSDLEAQGKNISSSLDKDAVAKAVAKNTELSETEAKEATENIITGYEKATTEAQKQIEKASAGIQDAKEKLSEQIEKARETAEDVSNETAKASIWAFVAVVIALAATSYAGMLGSNFVKDAKFENEI